MTENISASGSEFNATNVVDQAIVGKRTFTKEERIAKIDANIAALIAKRAAIEAGTETKKVAKVVVLPSVGDIIEFRYGRTTATTEPTVRSGQVFAVKESTDVDGKRTPAIIKVLCGEGAEAEFVTVYPAQVVVLEAVTEEEASAE